MYERVQRMRRAFCFTTKSVIKTKKSKTVILSGESVYIEVQKRRFLRLLQEGGRARREWKIL